MSRLRLNKVLQCCVWVVILQIPSTWAGQSREQAERSLGVWKRARFGVQSHPSAQIPYVRGVSACCLTPASWEGLSLKAGGAKASVPAPVLSQPLAHTEPQLSSEKGSAARGSLSPCHPCPCPRAVPARHRREKLAAPAAAGSGPVMALPRATGASLVPGDAGKSWKCFTCATATSETASEFKRLGFPGSLCPLEDTSTFCCVLSLRQKSHFKSCFLFFSAF